MYNLNVFLMTHQVSNLTTAHEEEAAGLFIDASDQN